ncbi:amyloid-beta A4 precursor protein-binding family A member 2 isoform X2 [Amia ocellicauda]|uniref:amyloid-beta A4 precursor protein-binding family A member 2 isoform X2 n=1 Tax=Amia ocellicauda TaxID=2972642 RepID=UPI0034649B07
MAHRKRQGTTSGMAEPRARPLPAAIPPLEPEEEPELEELREPGVQEGPGVVQHSFHIEDPELKDSRPPTPEPPDQDCQDQSGDGDSSSDYVNNTSEEEDYDEGLPEEDEGVTYYIRYCPEDDSYLEGMDCNDRDYIPHPEAPGDTDECQEAVEEWAESEGQCLSLEADRDDEQAYEEHLEQPLDDHAIPAASLQPPLLGEEEEEDVEEEEEDEDDEGEESEEYCPAEEPYPQDYYAPEANGNSVRASPYRTRKGGDGEGGEDQEEDIDQIVAEIKMSMSMGSLSSATDPSPEEPGVDGVPKDFQDAAVKADPAPCAGNRHEGRPKSLNIPTSTRHNAEVQRGFKVRARTPEERQKWAQEQVSSNAEQPRKQQRSDLNGPAENNNIPEQTKKTASFPSFVDDNSIVGEWLGTDLHPGLPPPLSSSLTTRTHSLHLEIPGPCEPEDLIDGIIFAANYLGSTQLLSERNPSKNIRMMQAQEAVSRVKSPEGDAQTLTEVDLFISTQRIKVLNADTQETMMDNALRTISYIADIGNIVVLMARRRMPRSASQDCIETTPGTQEGKKQYKMICHVFESEDAQLIAQSIGQAFSVAYQEFLRANGINPEDLSQKEYSDIINTQEMYNDDLIHFSNSENCKELQLEKVKGEILGVVIVESGWGSILPTVILANMMNGGPAARSGKLSIGDQIMSINGTSLVGLPLATCQGIIKGLKNQTQVKLNIVSCPPVTTVLIKRPDLKYQLGFSVQNGIICSLMRGGIAERGGVRVGHRIIEINGQSVVATAHEKIVQALSNSVGEIHMKTMPAAMFRLLTGQETPMYI